MLNFLEKEFSLSGLAAWVLIIRAASAWGELKWVEGVSLFLILLVHYGKNLMAPKLTIPVSSEAPKEWESRIQLLSSDVKTLEDKISGVNLHLGLKTLVPESGEKG